MNPTIIVNEDNEQLKFTISNIDVTLVNAIRRTLLSDIPVVVFRTTPYNENKCNIIIPVDCNTSTNVDGSSIYKSLDNVSSEDMILDIGKKTIELINKTIDSSNTVFWNGPAGYYENKNFSVGSELIAKKIAENTKLKSLISIVGGGDTVAAIKNTGLEKVFTHLSTAGGAFLESLEGKELPGIQVLRKT